MIRLLILLQFCIGFSIFSVGQSQILLKGTVWKGTQLPLKKGTELYFQNDTLVMVDLEGYNPADQYFFQQKGDTLLLDLIDESSISCREGIQAKYKIHWANNGEKLYLKPILDPCISRFTLLVSESPWFRKREENEIRNDWYFLDPEKDNVPGIALNTAYSLLKFRKSQPVIVAIIDSPIDYTHEDLKEKIWVNEKETPDNQIDDDKNGFKDDINGWFFMCRKSGVPIQNEQPEATQIYSMWKIRFDTLSPNKFTVKDKQDFKIFEKAKIEFEKGKQIADLAKLVFSDSIRFFSCLDKMLNQAKEPVNKEQIKEWNIGGENYELASIEVVSNLFNPGFPNFSLFVRKIKKDYSSIKQKLSGKWEFDFNPNYNPRTQIGDHNHIPKEKMYGSRFLKNPGSLENDHGTHVAGIIGAKRGNGKGIEGIAENIKIMTLGAVPSQGDERDKDVANSIMYAANNGAKIINMSFAKNMSPFKTEIDAAIQYAEQKGVLMINASGNSASNTDSIPFYPVSLFNNGKKCSTWIEVGNSTHAANEDLVAPTSNFGQKTVDLFAPGTSIFSTTPGNTYESFSGTSMAAPMVTGVAALIWSYFPALTAVQLKSILLESVYIPAVKQVNMPGGKGLVPFSHLSKTGGILNAKKAIFAAEKATKKKKT